MALGTPPELLLMLRGVPPSGLVNVPVNVELVNTYVLCPAETYKR